MNDTKCCRDCKWWTGEKTCVGRKCENPKSTFNTPVAQYKQSATRACKMFESIDEAKANLDAYYEYMGIDHNKLNKMVKETNRFKTVVNSCMICHELTKNPNPFYICDKCKAKQNRFEELIDTYGELGKSLSHENLAEMFLNIIKQKPVSTGFIFDMFDKMDKMGD